MYDRQKNWPSAELYYRLLAEKGDANAQLQPGLIYDDAATGLKDAAESVKWYRRAAEQGNRAAQVIFALQIWNGSGPAQDYNEAAKWFRAAA